MTVEGPPPGAQPEAHTLDDRSTGARVIRGSAYRTVGYAAMVLLSLVSIPLITRHLGVEDFGRYVSVSTLMVVVSLVADAGLTTVGIREFAVRDAAGRARLMQNLLGLRIVVSCAAVVVVVGGMAAAGSEDVLIGGAALAGIGVILLMVQHAFTIPLHAELRLALATGLEVLRQALTVAGMVVLVAVGAGLLPFLAVTAPVGLIVALITIAALRRSVELRPRLQRDEVRYLLRESVPAAAASTLYTLFYRVGILMVSLLATATQTGYFATSFRVVEALVPVPGMLVTAANPALARFAETDRPRFVAAMQQLFDVSLILGVASILGVVFMAQPAIDVIAGSEFQPAVDILRIQAIGLGATFMIVLLNAGLWIQRQKRELVIGNAIGVVAAAGFTAAAVPLGGVEAGAAAMVAAEALLGIYLAAALLRPNRDVRPSLERLPPVAAAGLLAAAVWLAPVPAVPQTAIALAVYFGVLYALGALPRELWTSFVRRGAPSG